MDGVIAFSCGKKSRDGGSLFRIHPEPAHRIMDTREDAHRHVSRIRTDEHFIDLEDRAELACECLSRNVGQIEIYLVLAADAVAFETYLEDLASGDIPRNEIAV